MIRVFEAFRAEGFFFYAQNNSLYISLIKGILRIYITSSSIMLLLQYC